MEVLPFAAAVHFAPYPNQAEEWTAHPSVAGSNPVRSTSFTFSFFFFFLHKVRNIGQVRKYTVGVRKDECM